MKKIERLGVIAQVRTAFAKGNRLAMSFGLALGVAIPVLIFLVTHLLLVPRLYETNPHHNPLVYIFALLVLGGLLYSAPTVFSWGTKAFQSKPKAVGFTILLEGIMTTTPHDYLWLSIIALVYLATINAIATGCTLALGSTDVVTKAEPVATRTRKSGDLKVV